MFIGACNAPPLPPAIAISPASPSTTDDLVATIVADPGEADGDPVTWRYAWLQDGSPRADLTGATVPASETTRGEVWSVAVTPDDGTDEGAPANAVVTIADSLPVLAVVISPEAPLRSDPLVATVTGTDADDDPVSFTLAWTRDGQDTPFGGDTIPANTAVHGEVWEVTARPLGEGEPATDAVLVDDVVPTIASVSLTPSPAGEGSLLLASVLGVEDADGDVVTLRYDWYVDDVVVSSGGDDTLTGALFSKHQVVRVEVTPNDGFVDGAAVASDDLLIDDTPPSGSTAVVNPTRVDEATTVTCVPDGFEDVDGDPEGWDYAWEVNGAVVEHTASIDGSLYSRDDVVGCVATPVDGELSGAPIASDPVVVLDTAPTLASVSLSSTSPTENDTVTAVLGSASDIDGDTLSYTYAWFVDGVAVSTAPGLTGDLFARGDSIYVVVTPDDGTLSGAPVTSGTATSVNSAPTSTTVSITPAAAYTDDTLSAVASATDADGDPVSFDYAWFVDGAWVSSADHLAGATDFDRGQGVYVVATPTDGEATGPSATSATVTILDSAPGAPGVEITPSDPLAGDDLVCAVTTPATDPDGDPITGYTYAWDRDGTSFAGATTTSAPGDTVDGADVVDFHSWTCSVTASDGLESGLAGTDVVSGPALVDGVAAFCGDGTCDSDESCWSCGDDCGSCDCPTDAEVILYTPSAWTILADAVEADPSNCADYYFTLPAGSTDKTTPRSSGEPEAMHARGSHFHAVAEFHWATWSGESGTWYDKGVEFRRRMNTAGYDVDRGDTWAINELPSTVRSDAGVRADALEAVRGLYDGPSAATPTQGIVYVEGMGENTTNFSVYKPNVEDWVSDSAFWTTANLYVQYWAQEVYTDPDYTCVPGATVADVSSSINSFVEHVARHAEIGPTDANTAQSYFGRAYVPLMNAVWENNSGGYGNTVVDLDTMKGFVSHQVYAARSWSNSHNYPDGRVGFAWARSDGVSDTDLADLAARLASAIHHAYDEGGGSAAGACSPSGAYTWCNCEVTGAAFNSGWSTFESW